MDLVNDANVRLSSIYQPAGSYETGDTPTGQETDNKQTPTTTSGGFALEDVLEITKDLTGWSRNNDGTYTPSKDALARLGVSQEDTQSDDADGLLQEAKAERDAAFLALKNFDVSNDPALSRIVGGITSAWDSRIAEMDRINRSREAAIRTTGVRLGSRYTGGMGGPMGSIISPTIPIGV